MEDRFLTASDLRIDGSALGGAMLGGWTGPVWALRGTEWIGATWAPHMSEAPVVYGGKVDSFAGVADVRLDCRRPEVRDRATRILGPDLLPIHAAELRGEITAGEAAGLVWASVLRREAGLRAGRGLLESWLCCPSDSLWTWRRRNATHSAAGPAVWVGAHGWDLNGISSGGKQTGEAGRAAADAVALAAGYALREPGGILFLPLPDRIGRLETCS